jgi:hypothetical protein
LSGPHSHAPPHSTAIPKNLAPQLVL